MLKCYSQFCQFGSISSHTHSEISLAKYLHPDKIFWLTDSCNITCATIVLCVNCTGALTWKDHVKENHLSSLNAKNDICIQMLCTNIKIILKKYFCYCILYRHLCIGYRSYIYLDLKHQRNKCTDVFWILKNLPSGCGNTNGRQKTLGVLHRMTSKYRESDKRADGSYAFE